ncbi:hypothetical protein H8B09_09655 [Paenibacillus sp. PR3]|uniref:Uncharacterized protein n=1 Tax=Paenibacillus terricola TaxID=2763503 RepID=A0ABR8MSS0_9BACL|nr:hypothetical protein [Paenibacillus terricola]MBD3919018.1 hypothetical protein [Paenibacillus terricola]
MKIQSTTTSVIKLPFSAIQNVMMFQGFSKISFRQRVVYRARFDDTSTRRSYRLMIPVQVHDNLTCSINVDDAFFEDTQSIPPEIIGAAECKLNEVNAYLNDEWEKQTQDRFQPRQTGGMAPNMEEMIKLGKQMAASKTNQELREANQIPDPIQ